MITEYYGIIYKNIAKRIAGRNKRIGWEFEQLQKKRFAAIFYM